jgi:hypothetical protein
MFPPPDYFAPPSEPSSNESTASSAATQPNKPVNSASKEPSICSGSRSPSSSPTGPAGPTASSKVPATTNASFKSTHSIPTRKRKERSSSPDEELDASQCPYLCPECGFHTRGDKHKTEEKRRKGKEKEKTQESSTSSQKRKPRCSNCSGEGHNVKTCAAPCSLCGDEGHRRRECPLKLEAGQRRN